MSKNTKVEFNLPGITGTINGLRPRAINIPNEDDSDIYGGNAFENFDKNIYGGDAFENFNETVFGGNA